MTTPKKNAADLRNDQIDTNEVKGGKTYVSRTDTEELSKPKHIGEEPLYNTTEIAPDDVRPVEVDKRIGISRTRK